ncbi:HAD-IIIC family phosphatase [Labrys neptuniae]|nr:HAD-IIIC family phosphatase [Labrys neptuniae]
MANGGASTEGWDEAVRLADYRLNFQLTNALSEIVVRLFSHSPPDFIRTRPERMAVLSSSTTTHLLPSLRVGALRRGIWLDIYECPYGQYRQDAFQAQTALTSFEPTAVLFSIDAVEISKGIRDCRTSVESEGLVEKVCRDLNGLWDAVREKRPCCVIQQTILPSLPSSFGNNEHRFAASPSAFISKINSRLRPLADMAGIDLLGLDDLAGRDGLAAWHDRSFWLKARQEISLTAAPRYGDHVARLLAARQGRTAKCCVIDLDNTLWGGVIGDEGPSGIAIGQGSALGEAFLDFQRYLLDLRQRGVMLAVCSKNDEAIAREAFTANPEMLLKENDFACFLANWQDKPTNLRSIAQTLSIGLDSLVFVDDNPFERDLVRRELPMVSVPELPEDPAAYPACLADAGYFEGAAMTDEDWARADYYARSQARIQAASTATDLRSYLADLDMMLTWAEVDETSLGRTVQLINKTNQFNLTTRRYTEAEVRAFMAKSNYACLQFRLTDRFGDNGLIAVVIGSMSENREFIIDSWLMSCRVLGRGVEQAMLNVVAEVTSRMGACDIIGTYRSTDKNAMVADHYKKLGFRTLEENTYGLKLDSFIPNPSQIRITELKS